MGTMKNKRRAGGATGPPKANAAVKAVESEEAVAIVEAAGLGPAALGAGGLPGGSGPDADRVTPQSVTKQLIETASQAPESQSVNPNPPPDPPPDPSFTQQLFGLAGKVVNSGLLVPAKGQSVNPNAPPNQSVHSSAPSSNPSDPPPNQSVNPSDPKEFSKGYIVKIATALQSSGFYEGDNFKITKNPDNSLTIGPKGPI